MCILYSMDTENVPCIYWVACTIESFTNADYHKLKSIKLGEVWVRDELSEATFKRLPSTYIIQEVFSSYLFHCQI